jgi:hypothetical protein
MGAKYSACMSEPRAGFDFLRLRNCTGFMALAGDGLLSNRLRSQPIISKTTAVATWLGRKWARACRTLDKSYKDYE